MSCLVSDPVQSSETASRALHDPDRQGVATFWRLLDFYPDTAKSQHMSLLRAGFSQLWDSALAQMVTGNRDKPPPTIEGGLTCRSELAPGGVPTMDVNDDAGRLNARVI
ncbi:hypothetical protein CES87_18320 [Pseudomonas sp. ERMR1:02]|nr:hypothetical protein CES87_18320 [Pseudomonas sp. ERMR1:02]